MTAFAKSPPPSTAHIRHPLPELASVVITAPAVTLEGDRVPAGTTGTIVGVYPGGIAYEVEFANALGPATIRSDDLRPEKG